MNSTRHVLLLSALAFAVALPGLAQAQSYPDKLVRIVVPFPAGGTADLLPRVIGEKLSAKWGQSVIIENKTGAGGNIGAELVYNADADGYTLLASPPGPLAINHNLYKALRFDPTKWVPVTVVATVPNVLAAKTGLQADSVQALIAMARTNPGRVTYASQGNGSTSHLTANLFESMAGVKMLHVPYRGTAPALNARPSHKVSVSSRRRAAPLIVMRTPWATSNDCMRTRCARRSRFSRSSSRCRCLASSSSTLGTRTTLQPSRSPA